MQYYKHTHENENANSIDSRRSTRGVRNVHEVDLNFEEEKKTPCGVVVVAADRRRIAV